MISRGRWSLVILLVVLAAGLLTQLVVSQATVHAQTHTSATREGVFVVAGQISGETYGLYLVDYEKKTLCVYKYLPKDRQLRLMAARTYAYDVQLDEYNTQPLPRDIKKEVEKAKRLTGP